MRRRALLLGVAALALGGAASAQVPEIYETKVYGRVSQSVTTWTTQEILDGFGPSKPGMFSGSGVSKVLDKAGRVVRWGGLYVAAPILVNEALNWYFENAKNAAGSPLTQWWSDANSYPPAQNWMHPLYKYVTTPMGPYCSGIYNGIPRTEYINRGTFNGETQYALVVQHFRNGAWTSPESVNANTDYNDVRAQFDKECAQTTSRTLADLIKVSPSAADEVRDATRRFLDAHPQKAVSIVSPVPNINEIEDDVIDPGLDTDDDRSTDGDEVRRGPGVLTSPGNRPHEGDGPATDPADPLSKPVDTDGDGIPDWRDSDDDNDGVPDDEEPVNPSTCQKTATCNPDSERDTDGDGILDRNDPDDDNDGATDAEEEEAGTDPKDPESKPKPEEEEEEQQCQPGQVRGPDGKCAPEEDEEKCPEGYIKNSDTGKCEEEPEGPKDPVSDECGDLSFKRFTAHTGHFLRDVVFPCDDVGDILKPITDRLSAKFPFSLAASLNGWFQAPTGGGSSSELPSSLGIIPLDWGWLAPLWAIIKNIVGIALWAWFIYWLIDRFTPRAQI